MEDVNHKHVKRPIQNIIFRVLACILILAIGIFSMNSLANLKKPPEKAKNKEYALRVEAIRTQPTDVPVVITGYGEVHALKVVPISPEVSGIIFDGFVKSPISALRFILRHCGVP